jgi:hypothetical protein
VKIQRGWIDTTRLAREKMSTTTSHAATKLARLNERFASFYADLEQEKTHRRALETDRINALEVKLDALEREVRDASALARSERESAFARMERSVKELETKLDARLGGLEERLATSMTALTAAAESAHEALNVERNERATEMDVLRTGVTRRVEDGLAALDEERLARLEREAELISRVGAEMQEFRTKIDAERNVRESAVSKLASVVEEVRHASAAGEGNFHAVVLEEMSQIKAALAKERAERVEEDELIVAAVGEYSKSIQNGLRLANA